MLGTLLLQRLEYEVTGHVDAAAALYDFRSRPDHFAAVVTDLSMPRMSDFDLACELLNLRPALPILMTSGYVPPEDGKDFEFPSRNKVSLPPVRHRVLFSSDVSRLRPRGITQLESILMQEFILNGFKSARMNTYKKTGETGVTHL